MNTIITDGFTYTNIIDKIYQIREDLAEQLIAYVNDIYYNKHISSTPIYSIRWGNM